MVPDVVAGLQGSWIQEIVWREEIGSTNQLALELAESSRVALPALVLAERQTQGRGRQGKSWFSDEGGLTCSFVLGRDQLPSESNRWSQLALISGLAVAEAIEWWTAPAKTLLKWPNDVYLAGKKVSGILVESLFGQEPTCVVGIGVNVTTEFSRAEEEVQQRGIAIADVANRAVDRWHFLCSLCERLQEHLNRWLAEPKYFHSLYRQRCMLTGRMVQIGLPLEKMEGRCLGLSDAGGLLVEDAQAKRHEVVSGEVLRW